MKNSRANRKKLRYARAWRNEAFALALYKMYRRYGDYPEHLLAKLLAPWRYELDGCYCGVTLCRCVGVKVRVRAPELTL